MVNKIILILGLLLISVFAFGESEVDNLTSARLFYENEEYDTSYEILADMKEKNVEVETLLADVCVKLGKYDDAVKWYGDAAKKDNGNIKLRLNIVKIYLDSPIKNEKKANKELQSIYNDNKDPKVRKIIKKLLKKTAAKAESEKKFETVVSMSAAYNDNINNGTDKKTITVNGTETPTPEEMKKTGDVIFNTSFMTGYKIINKRTLLIEPILTLDYDCYANHGSNDKVNGALSVFSSFKRGKINWAVPIGAGVLITSNKKEEYTGSLGVRADIEAGKDYIITPHFDYNYADNFKSDYKSKKIGIGLSGKKKIAAGNGSYDVSYTTDINSNETMSNNIIGGLLAYQFPIGESFDANVNYTLNYKLYKEEDSVFKKKRNDMTNAVGGEIVYKMSFVNVSLGYEFKMGDSSIDIYDYIQQQIKIGVKKGF